jgi:hypothetical protein
MTTSRSLPSTVGRSSRTLLTLRPEESMLFHSHSGVLSPTVFSGDFPYGTREVEFRGLTGLGALLVQQEARTPNCDVNVNASSLGLILIGISQPVKSIPSTPTTRVPKRRWYANAPPGLHYALGPTLPRRPRGLADRGFATPNLCPWKPRMPGFRYS